MSVCPRSSSSLSLSLLKHGDELWKQRRAEIGIKESRRQLRFAPSFLFSLFCFVGLVQIVTGIRMTASWTNASELDLSMTTTCTGLHCGTERPNMLLSLGMSSNATIRVHISRDLAQQPEYFCQHSIARLRMNRRVRQHLALGARVNSDTTRCTGISIYIDTSYSRIVGSLYLPKGISMKRTSLYKPSTAATTATAAIINQTGPRPRWCVHDL